MEIHTNSIPCTPTPKTTTYSHQLRLTGYFHGHKPWKRCVPLFGMTYLGARINSTPITIELRIQEENPQIRTRIINCQTRKLTKNGHAGKKEEETQ
jgi:hypothetical protein